MLFCDPREILHIFSFLCFCFPHIGIDIDENLLRKNAFRIRPQLSDYVAKRKYPLTMELLCGDLQVFDQSVADCDAVVMIEV